MLFQQKDIIDEIKKEKEINARIYKRSPKVIFLSYNTNKLLSNLIFNNELLGMKVYVMDNLKGNNFLLSHGGF